MTGRHHHPVRGRLNSGLLALIDGSMHRLYGERKRALLADLPRRVVEIGPGVGANLRYYPAGTELLGVEPNRRMHRRLESRARKAGVDLELVEVEAEDLPLPDGSAAAVVSTLVLCSVEDPVRVVSEVRRVLRPGGRFLFLEHVAAPPGSWLRTVQGAVRRPWCWLSDGCRVDRDTGALLEAGGFSSVEIERFRLPSLFAPIAPHICGLAVR